MSHISASKGRHLLAFIGGACIGILGGLIGLGGAEFRSLSACSGLPLYPQ
jgi:hypothetical protein